jgi:rRNA maturation protein Nop10
MMDCIWTYDKEEKVYDTSCGETAWQNPEYELPAKCPKCGKPVKGVNDANSGV